MIGYFARRPLIANVVMFGLLMAAVVLWPRTGKEEMPEFAMESLRVQVAFPGASAGDVEFFVTKPIEERLKGLAGLDEITSQSAYSSSSFQINFAAGTADLAEKVQEVKDAVNSTPLPREAEEPTFRQFKSSEKAIIDIGLYLPQKHLLTAADRQVLQERVLSFQNQILTLPEISGVTVSGYLAPELQIKVDPAKLQQYEVSMEQIRRQLVSQHVRQPLGSLEDQQESDVTLKGELASPAALDALIIASSFNGRVVRLRDVAEVVNGFAKATTISKVQGHEGIILNIKKSPQTDILTAQKAVAAFIASMRTAYAPDSLGLVLIDDESYDVRNRLNLVASNGLIGFVLIVGVLFIFLDLKAGIWVAMGLPFALAFTLIMTQVLGYTINNMTLAAIIVVLGIVVDDAIIVAENISRRLAGKQTSEDAATVAIQATKQVTSPIIASILTTCAAFVPLYFFSGRFGLFVKYIPTIIFLMLLASLLESFYVLPSHMLHGAHKARQPGRLSQWRAKLLTGLESSYSFVIAKILRGQVLVYMAAVVLMAVSYHIMTQKLNYVMFPREESRDFRVKVIAEKGVNRLQMAAKIRAVEDVFLANKYVTSVRSYVGQSRRGGQARDHEASLRVEVVPPSERAESLNGLLAGFRTQLDQLAGFQSIRFQKSRFGSASGSPIVIEVRENDDGKRQRMLAELQQALAAHPDLTNVEVERPLLKPEYTLRIARDQASRLGINYDELAATLRAYIRGHTLYTLNQGDEEVDVILTSHDEAKAKISDLLGLTVANNQGYLVPIRDLVMPDKGSKPANIERINFKRATRIFADIKSASQQTPLAIAAALEAEVLPAIKRGTPSGVMVFRGEVADSRESQGDFSMALILVLGLIFVLLVFLFDALVPPLLIAAIIPFGVVGTSIAFWLHGYSQFGFFAVVGTLGMIGVVINDSIVLVDKLLADCNFGCDAKALRQQIAAITATRLRAVIVTTLTTVAGLLPTAYGLGGYDSMLAEMMLAMAWGLVFGMLITLVLVPCLFYTYGLVRSYALRRAL